MIADSSALVAVIGREPSWEQLVHQLAIAEATRIGAPTLLETSMVVSARFGPRGRTALARLLQDSEAEILPFGPRHAAVAHDAFLKFGKGRHPAALNFGDCCCYATAALAKEPLLYIGEDFALTDLDVVDLSIRD
jgi:ribonuclease VapC